MKEILVKQKNGMISHEGWSDVSMERLEYDPTLDFSRKILPEGQRPIEDLDDTADMFNGRRAKQKNYKQTVKTMIEDFGVGAEIPTAWVGEQLNVKDEQWSIVKCNVRNWLKRLGYGLYADDNCYIITE